METNNINEQLSISNFKQISGEGVVAKIKDRSGKEFEVCFGNRKLMKNKNVQIS